MNMLSLAHISRSQAKEDITPLNRIRGKNKKSDCNEYKDPAVYFTMAIMTDEEPTEIQDRVWQE
jgi:hypothetical protein